MSDNALEKSIKLPIKKVGLAAKIHEAQKQGNEPGVMKNPMDCTHRLGLVFDDSGSMSGVMDKAQSAVDTFLKNSNPNETAIAVYPLCTPPKSLICNFVAVYMYVMGLKATGGTPLYGTLLDMLEKEPITRAVAFSDGEPTDTYRYVQSNDATPSNQNMEERTIEKYCAKKVPIDTIYVGYGEGTKLQTLSEKTGGIFLKFTDMESLKSGLKYLTPQFRGMLADPSVKEKLEKGELK